MNLKAPDCIRKSEVTIEIEEGKRKTNNKLGDG